MATAAIVATIIRANAVELLGTPSLTQRPLLRALLHVSGQMGAQGPR